MNRPNPSDEHGVLSGLGRWRHSSLVRWGFAYGAAAWVLLQALSLLAGVYGWPAWVMRLAVALSLTGFFSHSGVGLVPRRAWRKTPLAP